MINVSLVYILGFVLTKKKYESCLKVTFGGHKVIVQRCDDMGVQFLWISDLPTIRGLIFVDAYGHSITCSYKHAYFVGLIFKDRHLSAKT